MPQIRLTGIPSNITEKHQEIIQKFFTSLDWRTQKTISQNYGRDHNTLIATIRRAHGGGEETVPFQFKENTLKSPKLEKYNKRDLALVQLLGWHVFSEGTHGSYVHNPTFSYTLEDNDVIASAKANNLEHFNGDCIIAIKSPGAKANPEEGPDGKTEFTPDGSMFLFSPYSGSKGSTAFFYKGRHNFAELSDGAQFLGCSRVQAYGSPELRALLDQDLRIANCPLTDILNTGDPSEILKFNNRPGVTIENGNELGLRTKFWRTIWRWDKKTKKQIKAFLENRPSTAATKAVSPSPAPTKKPPVSGATLVP